MRRISRRLIDQRSDASLCLGLQEDVAPLSPRCGPEIVKRLLNAYWMLGPLPTERQRMDSDQSRALTQLEETTERREVDRLAATNGSDRVAVAAWHHCVDQYRQGTAQVTGAMCHLPCAGRPFRLRHYRIDHAHSNSYSAWAAAGRTQNPSAGQLPAVRAHEGLAFAAEQVAHASGHRIAV